MRSSYGNPPGSSGGPPGTGMRPGSGRRPGSGQRLKTGAVNAGAGTQAAQGIALSASINVHDRPVTGQGVMGMRLSTASGRLVEDSSYYIGLLNKRITAVQNETRRLNGIIESGSKDSVTYTQLEKRYDTLIKNKEQLEGQLADYNLAMDKTRTSTDPEDVRDSANRLAEKNRQSGQELDRMLMMRKQKEAEANRVEEQIEGCYREMQSRINELEPGKLRAYNDLLTRQRDLQERVHQSESKLNEVNSRIARLEEDDKSNSHRKEYAKLERQYQSLRKDAESLQEELDIANMDPKEAHAKFAARVNEFKANTKALEEKANMLKEEIQRTSKQLEELEAANATNEAEDGDDKKYELLVKRDQDMQQFMDKFDETRIGILQEQQTCQDTIVALLESISKDMDESGAMPTQEALGEMEDAKAFKERNLATAQRTMESLQKERAKIEANLVALRNSEPRMNEELTRLKQAMPRMKTEIKQFQDIEGLRTAFETTQSKLSETKHSYIRRRDAMRQQTQSLSVEYENLKKALTTHEVAKEIEETEKRLKHLERSIFELKEFVETKTRETDFELVKESCLKMIDSLNTQVVRRNANNPVIAGPGGGGGGAMGPSGGGAFMQRQSSNYN